MAFPEGISVTPGGPTKKVQRLTVEVEDPSSGGGLAVMRLDEVERLKRSNRYSGLLGLRLRGYRGVTMDAGAVGDALLRVWGGEEGLDVEAVLAVLQGRGAPRAG